MYDNENDFNGLLDTFWITRHSDNFGAGREGTHYGILSERTDAHFDWPNSGEHGRIKFQRIDVSDCTEGTPVYKCSLGWDKSAANEDSELQHETGQWRPWYHCVDSPEDDDGGGEDDGGGDDEEDDDGQPLPPGGPGTMGPPEPTGTFEPKDDVIVGLAELRRLIAGDAARRLPPPGGAGAGRIMGVALSHHPPLVGGLKDAGRGYLAISVDAKGHRAVWVDRRLQDPSVAPWWERLVVVPREVPAGRIAVTDGSGGVVWTDPREVGVSAATVRPVAPLVPGNLG